MKKDITEKSKENKPVNQGILKKKPGENHRGPVARWFGFTVSSPSYTVKKLLESCLGNDGAPKHKIHEIFAPTVTLTVKKNGKILEKIVEQPRGYIFIKLVPSVEAWTLIFGTDGIRRYLGERKPVPIPDEQISAYKESLHKEKIKAEQPFYSGDLVRIKQGVFKAMAGRVVGTSFDGKLKIELAIFSKIVPVEVNVKDVEKL